MFLKAPIDHFSIFSNDWSSELLSGLSSLRINLPYALSLVGMLWVIHLLNLILGYRLNRLGLVPRHPLGLIGLPFFSFLHADFTHLFFNSIPLAVLIPIILIQGKSSLISVTVSIVCLSGLGIWLLGRRAVHLGSSSLVMGYWGYLLLGAYHNPSVISILCMFLCLYYCAGLIINLFPREAHISWEGHVLGFLAGVATLYLFDIPSFKAFIA